MLKSMLIGLDGSPTSAAAVELGYSMGETVQRLAGGARQSWSNQLDPQA